jgi:hypothetical protein
VARDPLQIRADLNALGDDPAQRYQQERARLEQELIDAAAEHTDRLTAYRELRAEVEARIATAQAMADAIRQALQPVLLMMTEHRTLTDAIDDTVEQVIALSGSLRLSEGPPPRQPCDWPAYVAAHVRRAR